MDLHQAYSVKELADQRGEPHGEIATTALYLIDALEGVPDIDVESAENDVWSAIGSHPSSPDYFAAARAVESYFPVVVRAA